MGYDLHSNPEKFGLKSVGEVDFSHGAYAFDLLVVWVDASGQLFYGEEAGCSCPTPFEDFGIPDLTRASKHEIAARIGVRLAGREEYDRYNHTEQAAVELIEHLMTGAYQLPLVK